MKTIALLLALTLTAAAQYYTYDGRPLNGMSFDDPPAAPPREPVTVFVKDIDPASAKFAMIFKAVSARYEVNEARFIELLKSGKTFYVTMPAKQSNCTPCSGWGKVHDSQSTSADRKSPCKICRGSGKTPATLPAILRWGADASHAP